MSVRLEDDTIFLEGQGRVEDAEPLLQWLHEDGTRAVDMSFSEYIHTSVLQILLALRPSIRGTSLDPFLRDWIAPIVAAEGREGETADRA